jgi:deoxycytidylate deaminase
MGRLRSTLSLAAVFARGESLYRSSNDAAILKLNTEIIATGMAGRPAHSGYDVN